MPDTRAVERTLDEIKREVIRRTDSRISPFQHVRREEVEAILGALTGLDPDHWAEQWCRVGLAWEEKGDALAKRDAPAREIAAAYYSAYDYCRIGRYPCASTPGKQEAYRHSLRAFRKAAQHFEVPLEIVEIPFRERRLVGYLQVPPGAGRPPVALHWGGVDGWKEDRQRANDMLHRLGVATLVVDMPGTGESPVLYSDPDAERTYSAWLDHLGRREDVDGSRVGVWGGSFGAYWAARLAYTEAPRLKAAVFHGGNIHYGFQPEWLRRAFTRGASTYLFGPASLLEARGRAMGTRTMEEFIALAPRFSLKDMGLLDRPSAPILCVNGKLDDQAPVEDIHLLLEHGEPKCARIYPQGGHMGRTPGMPEDEITRLITGWLHRQLAR
ncbi:MAG TPA: alpha/beta fold hydrolase [Burkholderiales bacterium]|nr:alpha/beta fold hydrolase [Burkholderiales bacterium]